MNRKDTIQCAKNLLNLFNINLECSDFKDMVKNIESYKQKHHLSLNNLQFEIRDGHNPLFFSKILYINNEPVMMLSRSAKEIIPDFSYEERILIKQEFQDND